MYDLYALSDKLGQKLDKICELFNIPYKPTHKYLTFPCPIHDSNKQDSCTIFLQARNGLTYNWRCFTAHCEETYGKSIISFIYALLHKKDATITRNRAIEWIYAFLGEKPSYIHKADDEQKRLWIQYNQVFTQEAILPKIYKEDIRKKLIIPSEYYLNRGFSKQILCEYDIGTCFDKTKEMYMRSVFPLFDESGSYMIGCVGRSINEKCSKCNLYHYKNIECPTHALAYLFYSKWKNSNQFTSSKYFFNLWNAKESINNTETVVLLEGQGDVLRFEEAKIHNSLGLFGDDLTDSQMILLERLNCRNVIIGTDNDAAGHKAREKITSRLERMYNIYYIDYQNKDAGETSIVEIQNQYSKIKL